VELAPVQEGLFFEPPRVLPRGVNALPREEVLAAQRERLMVAVTELIAARGYPDVTIGEIAARSGVSRGAFYDSFVDKQACAFAAYDRFIARLLVHLAERGQGAASWSERVDAMLDGYFEALQRDPVVARAYLVEIEAAGPAIRAQRRNALRMIAQFLRSQHEEYRRTDPELVAPYADEVYLSIVHSARQLACDALDEHDAPDLRSLGATLTSWLLTSFGK
jgi:AcrR family transcriptional regulator